MKKWYKSAFCKGMLILVAHISLVAVVICVMIGLAYPGQNYGDVFAKPKDVSFEETTGFAGQMRKDVFNIINMIDTETMLSTEGKIDLNKIIDIPVFHEEGKIAETPGEFSFKLRDILNDRSSDEAVVVCRRPEGELKYQYYTPKQFTELIKKNNWKFPAEIEEEFGERTLYRKIEEEYYVPETMLYDQDGNVVFEAMWGFGRELNLLPKTVDGKNLLEVANISSTWNGRLDALDQMFDEERYAIMDRYQRYKVLKEQYAQGDTNVSYLFVNYDAGVVRTNREEYQLVEQAETAIQKIMAEGKYILLAPTLEKCIHNMDHGSVNMADLKHNVGMTIAKNANFAFLVSVDTQYPIQDAYYGMNLSYNKYKPWINCAISIGAASIVIFLISMVWLTAVAGRSNQKEGVALLFFDKWKTEIGLIFIGMLIFGAFGFGITWIGNGFYVDWNPWYFRLGENLTPVIALGTSMVTVVACAAFLTGYLSLVRRLKAKTIWKNSILKWLVTNASYIYRNRSCVTKGVIVGITLFFINFLFLSRVGFFTFLAAAADVFAIIVLAKHQIEKEKIKQGILRIADGDSEYKIPLEHLMGDNREIAENVNHIGEGIQSAVDKSLKDERLKTDLITNVSHDIKTPLTSIINYVGLLKQEHFEDPKIQKYLDVLDQKSQRLKTLTEDVVEASKISSGNINLEYMDLNLVELIHQTTGEFAEKFEKKGLQAVVKVPERPVLIRVDGRRMWRVVENIYNNAAKYAMPGTRVYVDVVSDGKQVQFSLKNISEYPLNITADELTERFIRGDISRSTEGSGLGLSIAKNLTEMQGGQFEIYVDGDLFKVTITFPQK